MNPYEVFDEEIAKLADHVDLADDEIQEKFADDFIGGILAAEAYYETMAEAEKAGAPQPIEVTKRLLGLGKPTKTDYLKALGALGAASAIGAGTIAAGTGGGIRLADKARAREARDKKLQEVLRSQGVT